MAPPDAPVTDADVVDVGTRPDAGRDAGADAAVADAPLRGRDELVVSPTTWDFGTIAIRDRSAPTTFTVSNVGDSASSPIAVSIRGAEAIAFEMVPDRDTCSGSALSPRSSCTIDIAFAPPFLGTSSGLLEITTAAGAAHAFLGGTGTEPRPPLAFDRDSYDFGSVAAFCPGVTLEVVVTHVGVAPTARIALSIEGRDASSYTVESTTCELGLEPGESCRASVLFAPVSEGTLIASLKVSFAAGAVDVPLTGIGTADCGP